MAGNNNVWLYCGKRFHGLEIMLAAIDDLDEVKNLQPEQRGWRIWLAPIRAFGERIEARSTGDTHPHPLRLELIVSLTILRGATDPQDKIFSLYGITEALGLPWPEPDYAKPAEDVFTEAMRCIIENDGSIELLDVLTVTTRRKGLPSWFPISERCRTPSPSPGDSQPREIPDWALNSRMEGRSSSLTARS